MGITGNLLICPICKSGLMRIDAINALRCANGHSFDIARQGYVNLLTSNQKHSKAPGDSVEMVVARREFLTKGFYDALSDSINDRILRHGKNAASNAMTLLDIGCGEGYYAFRLLTAAAAHDIRLDVYGMDISKDAVKLASAAVKAGTWFVGNSHFIPLKDASYNCILSVFSPILSTEVARLLNRDGIFLRVLPGRDHLLELRQMIYPEVILGEEDPSPEHLEGLTFSDVLRVRYAVPLTREECISLIQMTPHFWKTTKADKEKLNVIDALTVTIDMRILVYGKNKEAQHV